LRTLAASSPARTGISGDQLPAAITAASLSMRPSAVWTHAPVAEAPTCVTVVVSKTTPYRIAAATSARISESATT
jgi:hypothetical protein